MDVNSSTRDDLDTTYRDDPGAGITEPLRTRPNVAVQQESSGIGGGSGDGGEGIVEQAQQKVGEVASQVGDKAGEVVEQVRERATSRMDQQKDQAAGSLWSVAHAIRRTGENLREKDQEAVAQITDRAAEQVERFSSYISHRDVNQLLNDVQHFARRQPAIFLGGAFALGLIGARFLKSTGQSSGSNGSSGGNEFVGQAYRVPAEGDDDYGQLARLGSGADMGASSGDYSGGYVSGGYVSAGYTPDIEAISGTGMGTDIHTGTSSGDWSGGAGATSGDYSGLVTAPPIRGVDPRVSGTGGYSAQDTGTGAAGMSGVGDYDAGNSGGYNQGYGQDYAQGSGNNMVGETAEGDAGGVNTYRQDGGA